MIVPLKVHRQLIVGGCAKQEGEQEGMAVPQVPVMPLQLLATGMQGANAVRPAVPCILSYLIDRNWPEAPRNRRRDP